MSDLELKWKLDIPDDATATLTATMSVRGWRQVAESVRAGRYNNDAFDFANRVGDAVRAADKAYSGEEQP